MYGTEEDLIPSYKCVNCGSTNQFSSDTCEGCGEINSYIKINSYTKLGR